MRMRRLVKKRELEVRQSEAGLDSCYYLWVTLRDKGEREPLCTAETMRVPTKVQSANISVIVDHCSVTRHSEGSCRRQESSHGL